MWTSVVVFSFLLCAVHLAQPDVRNRRENHLILSEPTENSPARFLPEDDCSRMGGQCLHKQNCPPKKISRTGRCPHQSSFGAVCCHGNSLAETRCSALGGQCLNQCPQNLVQVQAQDCSEQYCCVLV